MRGDFEGVNFGVASIRGIFDVKVAAVAANRKTWIQAVNVCQRVKQGIGCERRLASFPWPQLLGTEYFSGVRMFSRIHGPVFLRQERPGASNNFINSNFRFVAVVGAKLERFILREQICVVNY